MVKFISRLLVHIKICVYASQKWNRNTYCIVTISGLEKIESIKYSLIESTRELSIYFVGGNVLVVYRFSGVEQRF